MTAKQPILFFDGVCNLCNRAVQFVIKKDKRQQFLFAPLQSQAGERTLAQLRSQRLAPDSVVLYVNGQYYTRSSAALHTLRLMGGGWRLFYALIIVPRFARDAVYDFVARNRYRWFGRTDSCMVPTPELMNRFLKG